MAWETAVGEVNSPYSIDIPKLNSPFSSSPPFCLPLSFDSSQKCGDLRMKREILNFPNFLALNSSTVIGQCGSRKKSGRKERVRRLSLSLLSADAAPACA